MNEYSMDEPMIFISGEQKIEHLYKEKIFCHYNVCYESTEMNGWSLEGEFLIFVVDPRI